MGSVCSGQDHDNDFESVGATQPAEETLQQATVKPLRCADKLPNRSSSDQRMQDGQAALSTGAHTSDHSKLVMTVAVSALEGSSVVVPVDEPLVLFVPGGKHTQSQQRELSESEAIGKSASRTSRLHANSFASTASVGDEESAGLVSLYASGRPIAMRQAEFTTASSGADDTALSSLGTYANTAMQLCLPTPTTPPTGHLQPQRSSLFAAAGSGPPPLTGFAATHTRVRASEHPPHPVVQFVNDGTRLPPHPPPLASHVSEGAGMTWMGERGNASLRSASGRRDHHQSITSFAAFPSITTVPSSANIEGRLGLATFSSQTQ